MGKMHFFVPYALLILSLNYNDSNPSVGSCFINTTSTVTWWLAKQSVLNDR